MTTHPAPRTEPMENTGSAAEMAEMLALIGKVTADLFDRMEAQDKMLEDIRSLGRAGNALIAERAPLSQKQLEALERSLRQARYDAQMNDRGLQSAIVAEREALERLASCEADCRSLRAASTQLANKALLWKRRAWAALPAALLLAGLLALLLPPVLARAPLTCALMQGTWRDQSNGYAACYFLSQSD